uniref:Uncharacterized protein n=1 Tax=Marseillevirus LCMAC102 TaxID=2506603 RepID=A0A481YVJ3_9VIRU|nr:MAG: hypothetical protein LCMAC102_03110 [Marseillevirus LCMAC102]
MISCQYLNYKPSVHNQKIKLNIYIHPITDDPQDISINNFPERNAFFNKIEFISANNKIDSYGLFLLQRKYHSQLKWMDSTTHLNIFIPGNMKWKKVILPKKVKSRFLYFLQADIEKFNWHAFIGFILGRKRETWDISSMNNGKQIPQGTLISISHSEKIEIGTELYFIQPLNDGTKNYITHNALLHLGDDLYLCKSGGGHLGFLIAGSLVSHLKLHKPNMIVCRLKDI